MNPATNGFPDTTCKLTKKEDSKGLVDSSWRNYPNNSPFILQGKHSISKEVNAKVNAELTSRFCSHSAHLAINGIAVTTSYCGPLTAAKYAYQARQ